MRPVSESPIAVSTCDGRRPRRCASGTLRAVEVAVVEGGDEHGAVDVGKSQIGRVPHSVSPVAVDGHLRFGLKDRLLEGVPAGGQQRR